MVILGDLQPPAPLEQVLEEALCYTDIWWIPGNHDTDTDAIYDNLWRSGLRDHNLHGRSVMIHGVRIAGLGEVCFVDKFGCQMIHRITTARQL